MRATLPILTVFSLAWLAAPAAEPAKPEPKAPQVEFARDVLPMLEAKCNRCHGARQRKGGVDLRNREAMLKGGVSGPALVPGDSGKSLIVELIHFNEMPPKKNKNRVTPEELKQLKAWIDAGAPEAQKRP
jgi:mono/diheme cytochrome c family protein